MSFQALSWALAIKTGTPSRNLVLAHLANRADDNGDCYPSFGKLVDDTELSRSTVKRCISELEEAGYIKVTRLKNGAKNRANLYRLNLSYKNFFED